MAMATDITVDDILDEIGEDFLTCTICFDQYTKPKILPCHHTYCEHCLYALVEKSNGVLMCPSCRKLCDIPTGGVQNLENNFFLNSLLETVQKRPERRSVKVKVNCEICEENDASHVCIDCQLQQYCSNCAMLHKKSKGTCSHIILSFKDYEEKKASDPISVLPIAYCDKHKTSVFRFYCETCQVPICSECVVIDHPNTSHAYQHLDTVAAEIRDKLLEDAGKLESKAKEADESKREATEICNQYVKKRDDEKMKVLKKADDIRKSIKTEECNVKDDVKEEYEIRIKNQYIYIDKLHFLYSRLVSMINYLEFIRRQKNAAQLVQREDSVNRYTRELEGLEYIPNIVHGEVEFVPAKERAALVGNLMNTGNASNGTNCYNEEKETSQNADQIEECYENKEGSECTASNVELAAVPEADSVPKTIDDCFLICAVCFEQFSNPKILPCHHTFCESCLHVIIEESVEKISCPLCKKTCQLTIDGVSTLKDNTYMQSLKDTLSETPKELIVLSGKCSFCDNEKATHICIGPQLQLCCVGCRTMIESLRNTRMTTAQFVITVEEYQRSRLDNPTSVQVISYCETHMAYPVNLYCNTCKLPICSACLEIDHPRENHDSNLLKRVSDGFIKILAEVIQKLNEQAGVLKERQEEAKLFRNALEVKRDNLIKSITQRAEKSNKSVHYEEQRLLGNLETMYSLKIKTLQSDIDHLQMTYCKLVSMLSYIEMSRVHKNAAELLMAKKNLNERIEELFKMESKLYFELEMAVFQPCDDVIPGDLIGILRCDVCIQKCSVYNVPKRLGKGQSVDLHITTRDSRDKAVNPRQKIEVTMIKPDESSEDIHVIANSDGTHTVTFHGELIGDYKIIASVADQAIAGSPFESTVTKLVKTFGKYGKEDGRFDNPKGLAFTEDGNLAVADQMNHRMQVIDLDGKMVTTFTFNHFEKTFNPFDVAISKEGLQFLTDRENNQVVVSDVKGKFMRSFGQAELRHPLGIAIHPLNGIVYVTDWDGKGEETDTDAHWVRKYTQEGEYINSFGGYGEKKGQFCAPYSVDFDSKGKVYVSDFNNSRVQVFDERDRFVRSFGCHGDADGQFEHPSGIVVSRDNFVYVVDEYANKIQKFDTNGRFLYRIDSEQDNLNSPRGIVEAVDDGRKVIVSDGWNHCIKVFVD